MNHDNVIYEDKVSGEYIVFALTEIRRSFKSKRKAIKYYDQVVKAMDKITYELIQCVGSDLIFYGEKTIDESVQVLKNIQLYRSNMNYKPRQFYINVYKLLVHSIDLCKYPTDELLREINEFHLITSAVK